MSLRILPQAKEEARAAADRYERQRAGLGDQFLDALEVAFAEIQANPLRFPKDLAPPTRPDARRAPLGGFPHLVVDEIHSGEVVVFAVAHPSQAPGYWRNRTP